MTDYRDHLQKIRERDFQWMTDDQFECFEMLCDLCKGYHHVGGIIRSSGRGIYINLTYGFYASTFDFSGLTEAVVLAHDRCIRFEIKPSGPKMLKLFFHKRHTRDGDIALRHPELEEHIELIRKRFPKQ